MNDWELLLAERSWLVDEDARVEVGAAREWDRGTVEELPRLSRLLASATVTPVNVDGVASEVLAWGEDGSRRGWWCARPADDVAAVHPAHRELLGRFGGINEVFGGPASWWSPNHPEILTAELATMNVASAIDAYRWIWEDAGLEVPIRPEDYYVVSREANGNLTIAERTDGRVLLFAADHAYDGVTVLDGCPEYSLYTIDGVSGLVDWIEQEARVWALG